MGALSGLKAMAGSVAEARRGRVTRRAIEQLPAHLRKDIGWPQAD